MNNLNHFNSSVSNYQIRFLRIYSQAAIVCNNSFRDMLSLHYNIETISFKKIGPLRKYTQKGVIRLKFPIVDSLNFPHVFNFRNKNIEVSPITDEEGIRFERENSKKLYITGVHYETTPEDLKEAFSRYGTVLSCKIMEKHNIYGSRFGYILFDNRSTIEAILKSGEEVVVHGCRINVAEYLAGVSAKQKQIREKEYYASQAPQTFYEENFAKHERISKPFDHFESNSRNKVFECVTGESSLFGQGANGLNTRFDSSQVVITPKNGASYSKNDSKWNQDSYSYQMRQPRGGANVQNYTGPSYYSSNPHEVLQRLSSGSSRKVRQLDHNTNNIRINLPKRGREIPSRAQIKNQVQRI